MMKRTDDPMEAMKMIAEMQHRTIDVQINDDISVTLRSLGAKDETDTVGDCMQYWGQAYIYKHKIETLARSIIAINGKSFSPVLDSGPEFDYLTPENKLLKAKRDAVGSWNQSLVDMLYNKYANMIQDVERFMEKIKITAETNAVGAREALEKAAANGDTDGKE